MPAITLQDLENARTDAQALEAIVNGASGAPDVVTRLGVTVKPIAKLAADLSVQFADEVQGLFSLIPFNSTAELAAALPTLDRGQVVYDRQAGLLRSVYVSGGANALQTLYSGFLDIPADTNSVVPDDFVQYLGFTSGSTDVTIGARGQYVHGGAGSTAVDGSFVLTPAMRAELAAGRDIRLSIKLLAGAFTVVPYSEEPVDRPFVLQPDGSYELTFSAASYSSATSLRIRWSASQNSEVLGPVVLFQGQKALAGDSLAIRALQRIWAQEVAELTGDLGWGFGQPGVEDLSGAADLIGLSGSSNHGRTIRAAGHARVTASSPCRGVVRDGSFVTAVYRLNSPNNDVRGAGLGFSTSFSSSTSTASAISALSRRGNIFVEQHRVHLNDAQGNNRPVRMTWGIDNRPFGRVTTAKLVEASAELLGLFITPAEVPAYKFSGIFDLMRESEAKLSRGAVVDATLAASDAASHQYKTLREALCRGYGTITTVGGQELNEDHGLSLIHPVHIRSIGNGRTLLGGWEELAAGAFTANGDGTFSTVLTHPYQAAVAGGDVNVERKLGGAFQWFQGVSSYAAVRDGGAGMGAFRRYYDPATKTLTINDNQAGAVYRIDGRSMSAFIEAACRRGRATGDRRCVLERLDTRYGGTNIYHSNRGVLELRSVIFGRATNNGLQSENGAYLIESGEDSSIGEYVGNDCWGMNSFIGDPVRWELNSPGARHSMGGDGFATHGTYCYVEIKGEAWADQIGKMGMVVINPGEFYINRFRCGANGLGRFGSGAVLFTSGAAGAKLEVNQFEGDSFNVDPGVSGRARELLILPKIGTGIGASGWSASGMKVRKVVTLTAAGAGLLTAATQYYDHG